MAEILSLESKPCPCGQAKSLATCCLPYIRGEKQAETPVVLMRSRYTAYTLKAIDYIAATMSGRAHKRFQYNEVLAWAEAVTFIQLTIHASKAVSDTAGEVTFTATYLLQGKSYDMTEHSLFSFDKAQQKWFYVDSLQAGSKTRMQKIGRNDLCPCGSGKKYKKCCRLK